MAGASMKAIKGRIKSVQSTMQITKAMELVAASKLRRAKQQEEETKPFYRILAGTITDIITANGETDRYLRKTEAGGHTLYIVIAGDRGLAGGYNNNLFRMVRDRICEGDWVLPVGRKALEHYKKEAYPILTEEFSVTADVDVPGTFEMGELVCRGFLEKQYDSVLLVYTEFKSMLTQVPVEKKLLPLEKEAFSTEGDEEPKAHQITVYDPSPEEVLDRIIPQYISGMLYGAVCEAFASECASRRNSMSAANKNAGEMIDMLTLHYNRARQAMITQEITEIIAGSEAQ